MLFFRRMPRALTALVCRHVADGAPILVARRDVVEDAPGVEWHFACAGAVHDADDGRPTTLEHVVARDASAVEIALHPPGTRLERGAAKGRWHVADGPLPFPHRPSRRWPRFEPRFAPRPGERLEASDLVVLADVSSRGWHVIVVAADAEGPGYAFSIGLFRTFDHPEVVVFGLEPDDARRTLDAIAERIRRGERFDHGDVVDGVIDGRAVAFRNIPSRHYPAYLGYAVWFHGGPRFPALQCIWPDQAGNFPWDRWFPRDLRGSQPVLYEPEPA